MELLNNLGGVAGFGENFIARNDDSFVSNVNLDAVFGVGGLLFFGIVYHSISINNNGNITFGAAGLPQFTPWGMQNVTGAPMVAAYFADVDTRLNVSNNGPGAVLPTPDGSSTGSDLVWYDMDSSGNGVLTITWDDVGYYNGNADKLNAFQLRLLGAGDGNFAIEFRYETIN